MPVSLEFECKRNETNAPVIYFTGSDFYIQVSRLSSLERLSSYCLPCTTEQKRIKCQQPAYMA